ncbi:MAG: hypothetical protein ACTS43_01860 [Candidatus Hodgkinia cicadicola]
MVNMAPFAFRSKKLMKRDLFGRAPLDRAIGRRNMTNEFERPRNFRGSRVREVKASYVEVTSS